MEIYELVGTLLHSNNFFRTSDEFILGFNNVVKESGQMKKVRYPKIAFSGGLGNQLFQWSAAHSLFGDKGFYVDLTHYYSKTKRVFELNPLVQICRHNHNHSYYQENFHVSDLSDMIATNQRRNSRLYLNGIFQNGDFVDDTFPEVEKELAYIIEDSFGATRAMFKIPNKYAVIHVRRGDYPISQFPSKAIGQLDDDFYIQIAARTNLPLILLTESALDVTELSRFIKPCLVLSQKETNPWQSLALMAKSEFFIGSNSTLSWWGAYLASKQEHETWLPGEWSQWGNYNKIEMASREIFFAPSTWRASL